MYFIYKYWNYFYRYVGTKMFLLMTLAPVIGVLDGFGISLLIPVFTGYLSGNSELEPNAFTNFISALFESVGLVPTTRNLLIAAISLIFLKSILRLSHITISATLNSRLMATLRSKVINNFSEMRFVNYLNLNTGHVLNTAVGEVNRYAAGLIAFLESINTLFIVVGYGVAVFLLSWKATLYMGVFGGLVSFIYAYFNKKSKQYSREVSSNNKEYAKHLIELVNFFKYLKATSRFGFLKIKLKRNIQALKRLLFFTELNRYIPNVIQEPLSILLILGLFSVNSWLMHEPVSVLIIVLGISYRMTGVVSQFQGRKQNFYASIGSLESVTKMLTNLEENREVDTEVVNNAHFEEALKLENVKFCYEDGKPILDELNLSIRRHETVAFVGASGAGKSTLIDILCGLLTPESGKIYLDENPHASLCFDAWRERVGYVTQDSIIFDTTVLENITMSESSEYDTTRLNNALTWSNSGDFINQSMEGLSSELGDKGLRLSGGQKQRVSLARELYKSPELLVLDEATSALDSNSEMIIKESLEFLKGKVTVIMIAHRLATVKHADRIFVLDQGKLVEQGTFNELISDSKSAFYQLASHQNL